MIFIDFSLVLNDFHWFSMIFNVFQWFSMTFQWISLFFHWFSMFFKWKRLETSFIFNKNVILMIEGSGFYRKSYFSRIKIILTSLRWFSFGFISFFWKAIFVSKSWFLRGFRFLRFQGSENSSFTPSLTRPNSRISNKKKFSIPSPYI